MNSFFKISLVIALIFNFNALASETTLRESPIYLKANGPQIGTLKAGVETEASYPSADGFCKIVLYVDSPDASNQLKTGAPLMIKGFEIGKATAPIPLDVESDGGKNQSFFTAVIKAKDLNPASIPERALEKTWPGLASPTRKNLDVFMRHFRFRPQSLDKKYETFGIYTNGLSTEPRLYFVFQKETLVAIIHLYDLKLPKVAADEKLKGGMKMIWLSPNKTDAKNLIKTFHSG